MERHARAGLDPDVTEPGGVEEARYLLSAHATLRCPRAAWRHPGHEPPDVTDRDRVGRAPAGPVEVGQEMAGLSGEHPCRSRRQLLGDRRDKPFQDFTGALTEARVRAHHPPRHPAGSLELEHHAGGLDQGVPPVPADLTCRARSLARDELLDHAG